MRSGQTCLVVKRFSGASDVIGVKRLPKIIVHLNVAVRMRQNSFLAIRKRYETHHHLLAA
jgi:hypothetical protein